MSDPILPLSQHIRRSGNRLTASRELVIRALVGTGAHLSADELLESVRASNDTVSRMTVYRTLELLCQLGLARPIYARGAARYVLMNEGCHHHFVCHSCDSVVEFEDCAVGSVESRLAERHGFTVDGHVLEAYGICAKCQE